ncbi:hypothetical protein ACJ41O_009341 [Fusarium nematophilum]
MEESAPKRRRTSPRTSLNIGGTPPSPEPASPRRRRPSYASPTKASLARHNPDVLERRRSRSPEKTASAGPSALPSFDAGVEDSPSESLAARLAGSRIESDAPTPGSGKSLRRVTGGMAAAARRTPSKMGQRATEPKDGDFNPFRGKVLRRSPAVEPEGDEINPFRGKVLRRSPPAGVYAEQPPASMPEPESFPPMDGDATESEHGSPGPPEEPSAAQSPSLAMESSPVRSPSPEEELPARSSSPEEPSAAESPSPMESPAPLPEPERQPSIQPQHSSPEPLPASMPEPELPPLVQPDSQTMPPPASQPAPRPPPTTRDTTKRRSFQNSPMRWRELSQPKDSPLVKPPSRLFEKPRKSLQRAGPAARATQERALPEATVPEPRKPRAFDPNLAKKRERDALQKEIEALEKDLETAQTENERIRLMQKSGRELAPSNQEAVIDLIQRQHVSAGADAGRTVSQQLVKVALNPAALLPFGKAPAPVASVAVEDKQADVKSHHPVQMTAEEELPYLELFSPFSISSKIAILPQVPDQPLRQLHSITFRSREIPGIFTARMDMTVNATDLTILSLDVVALEPAAKPELGPFVQQVCTGDCNRTMQRNVGILSWAMGEWLRVAVERAGLWCRLEKSLGSKDGVAEAASEMRTRKPKRRKEDEAEDEESTDEEPLKRADLLRYMGKQHFDVSIPRDNAESGSFVRLEWKTEFDWTGEAQSKLAVMVGVPGKWHQTDERGSLGKLPKLFAELVRGGEKPDTAVRTIVALMAGDQS